MGNVTGPLLSWLSIPSPLLTVLVCLVRFLETGFRVKVSYVQANLKLLSPRRFFAINHGKWHGVSGEECSLKSVSFQFMKSKMWLPFKAHAHAHAHTLLTCKGYFRGTFSSVLIWLYKEPSQKYSMGCVVDIQSLPVEHTVIIPRGNNVSSSVFFIFWTMIGKETNFTNRAQYTKSLPVLYYSSVSLFF